jgi:drug/metabolite transporter (DMT)-like permease
VVLPFEGRLGRSSVPVRLVYTRARHEPAIGAATTCLVGLRQSLVSCGVAISIPTSTLLFWCLAPFVLDPRYGNLKAVGLFACVGLFFPGTVALLNFESNRLMGPNIADALSSIAPLFAIALAIVILGELFAVLSCSLWPPSLWASP